MLKWRAMKKSPPFKPGTFALGFLGAYSVAALILFFTLGESLAESGSGTTPRSSPETISDNTDRFENYSGNFTSENGKPFFADDILSPNPSGPSFEDGLSGAAASGFFPDGGSA